MTPASATTKPKKKTTAKAKKAGDGKTLVIVESPSKAKTIGKFLGSKYKVLASVGHVRDLPKSRIGVDIEDNFRPDYINIRGKGDLIKELKKEAKNSKNVLLATDPDREGEAISWHIANLLGIPEDEDSRIVFNEITKDAIKSATKAPRKIDLNLVDAQQARRVLDRIVGYKISPILWAKVRPGLSAGRVQSAALEIIVSREREIQAFIPEEYWKISALLHKQNGDKKVFSAKLVSMGDKKYKDGNVFSKEEAEAIAKELGAGAFEISDLEYKERTRKPYAPYTTSSLQQDASNKIGFSTSKTMRIAQQLYEGVTVKGAGTLGLVSYIRTDSVRISEEADSAAKAYIEEKFSKEYIGNNFYSNKKKEIQDAHEAIRPSYVNLHPDDIADSLTTDQFKLYNLIWRRFVASRMSPAKFDGVKAEIKRGDAVLRATGSSLKFDGFLSVYKVALDEDGENMLPELEKGEVLDLKELKSEESWTQPPARFSEAALVKELEEKNIGRPSTYATIITTLLARGYVGKEKKALLPTELGFTVIGLLESYFKDVVDAGFTADMEDKLDDVEAKGTDWHKIIADFYVGFEKELIIADKEIEKIEQEVEMTDEVCELCGSPMVIKNGRHGKFMACSAYPECKNTKPILERIGITCPDCGSDIVVRRSKRGKVFYGCSGFPNCRRVYWDKPTGEICPECGEYLVEKNLKAGPQVVCSNKECKYKKP
ncbi:MAG: type I DNA topoisomerase [Clostridiales Family XIII bacterium]|jgi:DNA topoisomerase-1|nr:type I DNA topoisomerase [Clostridiales Family XIII bacterium]